MGNNIVPIIGLHSHSRLYYKTAFRIYFGLWEVPKIDDYNYDDDYDDDFDDDDGDYHVFSSSLRTSNTKGRGQ